MRKSEGDKLTNNVRNFINSKDSIIFKIQTNILLHGTIIIFCLFDILLYLFNCNYLFFKGTLFGFVFAIAIAGTDLINILVRICVPKEKIQYAYYGFCLLLISLYFNYIAFKLGLLPFNQLYGLVGLGVWLIVSSVSVYAIKNNIIYDRYNKKSESIYWFKEQKDGNDSKYGIVVTKYTIISALIYVIAGIILMLFYFIAHDKFPESPTIATTYGYVVIMVCLLMLCYCAHFAWKLVIKQIYINRTA